MEKKKKEKKKSKKKITQHRIPKYQPSVIRSLYFDVEGDTVHDVIKSIRSYQNFKGLGKIPEDETELLWPILKTKSLLFLQENAQRFFEQPICEWLQQLDPFSHDDPKILSAIASLNTEENQKTYNMMRSIWTTKEQYMAKFKPPTLSLFSEYYLSCEALSTLKKLKRTPQLTKSSGVFPLFSAMPNDLIWSIAAYLTHPVDIVNLSKCNKALYEACSEAHIWNRLCTMYGVQPHCKNVKKSFAAHYWRPAEQVMYFHEVGMHFYHFVIPSEESRVLDYATIREKYMLSDNLITAIVLIVNVRHFDKRLENFKYHHNYIHESLGLLKELIAASAKQLDPIPSAFIVRLFDCAEFNREVNWEAVAEDFPDLRALLTSNNNSETEDRDDYQAIVNYLARLFSQASSEIDLFYANRWQPRVVVLSPDSNSNSDTDEFMQKLVFAYLEPTGGLI